METGKQVGGHASERPRFFTMGSGKRRTRMKWMTILCGLLLPWSMLTGSSVVAGPEGPSAGDPTPASAATGSTPSPPAAETVVVISGSPDSAASEVVVKGGPSQGVRVIAPPQVTVTATGGDGLAGTPGAPGH